MCLLLLVMQRVRAAKGYRTDSRLQCPGGVFAGNVGGVLVWDAATLGMRECCVEGGVWTALLADGAASPDIRVPAC